MAVFDGAFFVVFFIGFSSCTSASASPRDDRARCTDLSEGDSQDGAARRLQMSTRKLQRELDAIRTAWSLPAAPVAQLTFRWALSPERAETVLPVEPAA